MLKAGTFVAGNYRRVLPVAHLSADGRRLGSVKWQPVPDVVCSVDSRID